MYDDDCTSAQADLAAERETPSIVPDVKGCTTPTLVREFASRKAADARGALATRAEHKRHCAVVDELRARGVLD